MRSSAHALAPALLLSLHCSRGCYPPPKTRMSPPSTKTMTSPECPEKDLAHPVVKSTCIRGPTLGVTRPSQSLTHTASAAAEGLASYTFQVPETSYTILSGFTTLGNGISTLTAGDTEVSWRLLWQSPPLAPHVGICSLLMRALWYLGCMQCLGA